MIIENNNNIVIYGKPIKKTLENKKCFIEHFIPVNDIEENYIVLTVFNMMYYDVLDIKNRRHIFKISI